jgi:prolyl-tRNA synthetase
MENGVVSLLRRDQLWDMETGKVAFAAPSREKLAADVATLLGAIQAGLLAEAQQRRDASIVRDLTSFDEVGIYFSDDRKFPGWVEVQWAKPTGAALEKVVEQLKALKLTIRNVPMNAPKPTGTCVFTGEPAVEWIYVAKAY